MNDIFFCLDQNYIKYVPLVLKSFIKYHDLSKYQLNFIVYDIQDHKVLEDIIKNVSQNINYIIKDFIPSDEFKKIIDEFHKIHIKDKFGIFSNFANWSRFYITDLYPEIEKGLYLDLDIVFNKNIDNIFKQDLNDKLISVIPEKNRKIGNKLYISKSIKKHINDDSLLISKDLEKEKNKLEKNYLDKINISFEDLYKNSYNCGVILFNFKLWKLQNISSKILNFLNYQVSKKELLCRGGTQTIMNLIVNDYEILKDKYNVIYNDKDINKIKKKSAIIHFKGIDSYNEINNFITNY